MLNRTGLKTQLIRELFMVDFRSHQSESSEPVPNFLLSISVLSLKKWFLDYYVFVTLIERFMFDMFEKAETITEVFLCA